MSPKTKTAATKKPKDKEAGCTAFSVSIKILTMDDKREIQFGLTKGCNPDGTSHWTIDFLLKEKKGDEMKTRVEVHVTVGTEKKKEAAEELAKTKELAPSKVNLLQGRVADRAMEVKPKDAQKDPELQRLLLRVL
jgi:predicted Zn-dependent protease